MKKSHILVIAPSVIGTFVMLLSTLTVISHRLLGKEFSIDDNDFEDLL